MRELLTYNQIPFDDNSGSPRLLDFTLYYGDVAVYVEVKEKRQPTKMGNWPSVSIPKQHVFILDELTARKMLLDAQHSCLILRDNTTGRYVFFSALELWTMPKLRVNRRVSDSTLKGKWMLDMRNGAVSDSLVGAYTAMIRYLKRRDRLFFAAQCVRQFVGEVIEEGGEYRSDALHAYDYSVTR